MNLRQITIFIDLAETLSTTKTAKNLYLAQPAVSLAIKELEGEYNIKLFNNIKQRLSLTDAGVELLAYAKNIINSVELFDEKANNLFNNGFNDCISSAGICGRYQNRGSA